MSADSKRKRGIAGKANAESSPYRMNGGGCYPMYMRRILGNLSYSMGRNPRGASHAPVPQAASED